MERGSLSDQPGNGVPSGEPAVFADRCVDLGLALSADGLVVVSRGQASVRLPNQARWRMGQSHRWLRAALLRGVPVYGVSHGVGDFHRAGVSADEYEQLQYNTIRSHCCAVGPAVDRTVVRGAMVSRAAVLARGYSGVRPHVVEYLVRMLNADVVPVVPGRGSVGASGDTVLLAHMAAVLIGDGLAYTPSSGVVSGRDALESIDLEPLRLSPRDGLGMINGLDFTISQLVLTLRSLIRLADWAIAIAALTADLVGNSDDPFQLARSREYALSHQRAVADRIMVLIGDKSLERQRLSGQDPYSIRCVPQVLGSSISAIEYACEAVAEHLAAVVDNPIIDSQQNRVLHGGMFHGQHLAIVADFAAIATATMANVSHERIRLLLGGRALPEKQAYSPGLTNGLMMVETTTASLVAAIRAGVTPLSVHNVSATTAQEDHVSMAWEAARRLNTIVEDVRWVIAAEGLAASNGVRMVGANTLGAGTARVADRLLARAQLGEQDQEMTTALEDLANLIATEPFD